MIFAAAISLTIIQYSFRHGRLIRMPMPDDVGYFADSAMRTRTFYDDGFRGLVASFRSRPAHSPYSSIMATSGFVLFGMHDWAPYVMNSLLALGYFLVADWLLRGVKIGARVLCFVVLAAMPFVNLSVHEFRPDFAVALFTAAGIIALLAGPFVYGSRRRRLSAGVFLGLAMLTKPPVFPQTLALGCFAIFLATITDWIVCPGRPKLGAVARAWVQVLLPFALIPLPHYYRDQGHIFHYIHSILFGSFEKSYAFNGTPAEHMLYYVNGLGGAEMLGRNLWVIVIAVVSGMFVAPRKARLRAVAMMIVLVCAWIIPTVNKTKSSYFGLAMDTLLAFIALYLAGRALRRVRFGPLLLRRGALLLMSCLAALAVWNFQWPARHGNREAGWEVQRRQIVNDIFTTVVSYCDFLGSRSAPLPDQSIEPDRKIHASSPIVFFCCTGDFNADLLKFMAEQHQLIVPTIFHGESGDVKEITDDFQRADFIYCTEPGNPLIDDFLPFTPIEQPLLDAVQARGEFEQVGKWTYVQSTKSAFLYKRKDWTGFTVVSGFGDIEGPYPEYDMHRVRWGLGPASVIKVNADRAGVYEFTWRARADFADEVVTIKVDGNVVGTQAVFFSPRDMGENRFPVSLKGGEHTIEFAYSRWHTGEPRLMAVLFQHLNVAYKRKQ